MDEPKDGEEELLPIELGLEPILCEFALRGNPLLEDDEEELPLADGKPLPLLGVFIPVLPLPRLPPLLVALVPVLPLPRLLLPLLSPAGLELRPDPPEAEVL